MVQFAGYLISVLIGISLGLIGGGGSILTVPVFVYIFKIDPILSATYSLFVVGISSFVVSIRSFIKRNINYTTLIYFGIPSTLSIFITRRLIVTKIPLSFVLLHSKISRSSVFMILFAILMLVAAIQMTRKKKEAGSDPGKPGINGTNTMHIVLVGFCVGIITGLLGVGGGFIIMPALISILHLDIKKAIGTTLIIIAINSSFGFLTTLGRQTIDWYLLLVFSLGSILGIFIGSYLSEKISGKSLKKIFGGFVLFISAWIFLKETIF